MEITIKINGHMVSVEVSDDVAECYDQGRRKAENLSHEKRRHWDDREFDEYIVATEGLLPYQPTPEDIVCQRETLALLLSILDTCTTIQRERFLLYALYVNPRSPGAIGRFIGHRIISATLDRHAIALPDLLSPAFYDSETTLSQSGYK